MKVELTADSLPKSNSTAMERLEARVEVAAATIVTETEDLATP